MPAITSTVPGKVILFGEHAVVYGRPAIAVPVHQLQARAVVQADLRGPSGSVRLEAPDIGLSAGLDELRQDHPLRLAIRLVLQELGVEGPPASTVRVTSTIPVASGLGSGAAVSVAVIRAYATFLGHVLPIERVSALAFEVEKIHHGTPSGIDNTVVAYAMPVYYVRGSPGRIEPFQAAAPFTLVIGDTGIPSPTRRAVGDLRLAWEREPEPYERLFDAAGEIAERAREAVEAGRPLEMGPLMDENHALLQQMGVSCRELDHLVQAARRAGAQGAKLSGGGRGGNMIALVEPDRAEAVAQALREAGAVRTIITTIR